MTLQPVDPADVTTLVRVAARVLPQSFGLETFVAVNPLGGFEELPFEEAAERAADLFGAHSLPSIETLRAGYETGPVTDDHLRRALAERHQLRSPAAGTEPDPLSWCFQTPSRSAESDGRPASTELVRRGTAHLAEQVDHLVAHWCATWIGLRHSSDRSLWESWRRAAPYDPALRPAGKERIEALPQTATEAVAQLLAQRGVGTATAVDHLEAQLARLAGWATTLARLDERRSTLVDLAAVRMAIEHLLGSIHPAPAEGGPTGATPTAQMDALERRAVWQSATELAYADELLGRLRERWDDRSTASTARPDAQVAFCIDVRSEGMRRHLESMGNYQTIGFAGFFGLPIAVQPLGTDDPVPSCPVIVDPRAALVEELVGAPAPDRRDRDGAHRALYAAKHGSTSPYVTADAAGWVLGASTIARTLRPRAWTRLTQAVGRLFSTPTTTRYRLEPDEHTGVSIEDQITLATNALTAMGLTANFAPLVVLCGHRSAQVNNPFRSSGDCGACGGKPGTPNARILASMCNEPAVRQGLAEAGIEVPDDTWFVAGEHETTDDQISLHDTDLVPASFGPALAQLQADLDTAGDRNRRERWQRLPGSPSVDGDQRRSLDPAQVVADWGLVRNAAIILGPRSLTTGLDLDRRVFLHDYHHAADPEGAVLEALMTGPVVVAHWISSQYYFSTVDPDRFGAGSKVLHNLVDRIGVSVGASHDLGLGLPLESVAFDGQSVHQPLRLLVIVDAPPPVLEGIISRNPVLGNLFGNGWVRIVARGLDGEQGYATRARTGSWVPWSGSEQLPLDERVAGSR